MLYALLSTYLCLFLLRALVVVCVAKVELYEELGLGSSTANVQAMRLNVAVPPPPPDSVQVIRRKKPSLRKVVSTRRK